MRRRVRRRQGVLRRAVPVWLGVLIVLLLFLVLAVSVFGYAAYGRPGLDGIRVAGGGAARTIAVSGLSIVTVCLLSVVTMMSLAGTGCSVPVGAVVTVLLCGFFAALGLCVWLFPTRPARPTAPVPAPTRAPVAQMIDFKGFGGRRGSGLA
ncbi:hypothetical protein [Streptomyces sp. NPDC058295]|uniref:hypothetical protein n=1 Tax=Streptomyces sp. NPDC058295 TaxID=3346431 RepID=UPI0036EA6177